MLRLSLDSEIVFMEIYLYFSKKVKIKNNTHIDATRESIT
jgi:hypothetical protein